MAYDPIKAHEYYMKHRKLKGRKKSTKPKVAKKRKGKKAKKVTYASRTSLNGLTPEQTTQANEAKANVKYEKSQVNKKINEQIKAEVKKLKESMKGKSEKEIAVATDLLKQKYAETKKKINEYYKEVYAREVDKIKGKR